MRKRAFKYGLSYFWDYDFRRRIRNKDDLEEAPSAYKDIDIVMENQKDLVEILVELKPLAVIKG